MIWSFHLRCARRNRRGAVNESVDRRSILPRLVELHCLLRCSVASRAASRLADGSARRPVGRRRDGPTAASRVLALQGRNRSATRCCCVWIRRPRRRLRTPGVEHVTTAQQLAKEACNSSSSATAGAPGSRTPGSRPIRPVLLFASAAAQHDRSLAYHLGSGVGAAWAPAPNDLDGSHAPPPCRQTPGVTTCGADGIHPAVHPGTKALRGPPANAGPIVSRPQSRQTTR